MLIVPWTVVTVLRVSPYTWPYPAKMSWENAGLLVATLEPPEIEVIGLSREGNPTPIKNYSTLRGRRTVKESPGSRDSRTAVILLFLNPFDNKTVGSRWVHGRNMGCLTSARVLASRSERPAPRAGLEMHGDDLACSERHGETSSFRGRTPQVHRPPHQWPIPRDEAGSSH